MTFRETAGIIVKEHSEVFGAVDEQEIQRLLDEIVAAKKIEVFGMGRMKCGVTGFTMRLMHMGLDAHVVYDTTCPNIGPGDLLIVNGACTAVCGLVMRLAKKAGAKVCTITAHPEDEYGRMADFTVRLRGQVMPGAPGGEIPSIQPMASLFEQTIFVMEDILIKMLMEKCSIKPQMMERRHTNLDGYMELD